MKTIILATLPTSMASFVFAHDKALGDIPELYGSVLLDHNAAPTGQPMKGEGERYCRFIANPEDLKTDPNAHVQRGGSRSNTCSLGELYGEFATKQVC